MKIKEKVGVFLRGVAMGAADVVPGVSGGTIAFISGIYERLIQAIKNILPNLSLLFKGKFKTFRKNIDGTFLICLVVGIAVSLFSLAHLMTYLLDHYPIPVWSFFFGLVLASVFFVAKDIRWNWKTMLALLIFAILAFFVTSPENAPLVTVPSYWFIFLCAAIAICAMILPGISGSFILVLLGQYYFVLEAVKTLNIPIILVFIAGALVGIITFSNVLSRLFKHFKVITLAALTGFMVGSLNKIWPRKETLSTYIDNDGITKSLVERNVGPMQFETITGGDNQFFIALLCMVVGFGLIFVIELIAKKMKKKKQSI